MSTPKADSAPISVHRNYRSAALQPGGVVMNANLIFVGLGAYGRVVGHVGLLQSGVQPPGDDVGDLNVQGSYAFMGFKPGEVISVSFENVPSTVGVQQLIQGQMSLTNDWKTGHTTFSYTGKGGQKEKGGTAHNAKVNLVT